MSLRAILFDFDGVLADSEPVHYRMFQKILSEEGVSLAEEDYYQNYLGLDDRGCFNAVFRDRGCELSPEKNDELVRRKHEAFEVATASDSLLFPGVPEVMERLFPHYYTAIVSGALRSEILAILRGARLDTRVQTIVAAEEVIRGKPDPDGFLEAIRRLNRDFVPSSEHLLPGECVVIEDSPWGIEAAKLAGAKCVALTTSYPREKLSQADLMAPSLKALDWSQVEALFR